MDNAELLKAVKQASVLRRAAETEDAALRARLPLAFKFIETRDHIHVSLQMDFSEFGTLLSPPTYESPPQDVVREVLMWLSGPNPLGQYPLLQKELKDDHGHSDLYRLVKACRMTSETNMAEYVAKVEADYKKFENARAIAEWGRLGKQSVCVALWAFYFAALFGELGPKMMDFAALPLALPFGTLILLGLLVYSAYMIFPPRPEPSTEEIAIRSAYHVLPKKD